MFIIIVGPDGAGKTTLAKQLAKQTGFEIIKRNKPETEQEKKEMYENYCKIIMHKNNVIFDRFAYCEKVYGSLMRDESIISDEQLKYLESLLSMKGAIVIHCTDNIDNLWDRCTTRGERYITDKDTLDKIRKAYIKLFSKQRLIPVVEYRVSKENM
jgi:thymidylate kinase